MTGKVKGQLKLNAEVQSDEIPGRVPGAGLFLDTCRRSAHSQGDQDGLQGSGDKGTRALGDGCVTGI